MRRDTALTFLRLGQQVERASITCRVLAVRAETLVGLVAADPYLDAHHMAVLRSLASYQPFRRAALSGEDARTSVLFLLRDPYLPRSVSACLAELRDLAKGLPHNEAVLEGCADASVAVVAAPILQSDAARIRSFLIDLQAAIGALHHQIAGSYFVSPSIAIGVQDDRSRIPLTHTAGNCTGIHRRYRPPGNNPRNMERAPVSGFAGMHCRVVHLTTYYMQCRPVRHPRLQRGSPPAEGHQRPAVPEPSTGGYPRSGCQHRDGGSFRQPGHDLLGRGRIRSPLSRGDERVRLLFHHDLHPALPGNRCG